MSQDVIPTTGGELTEWAPQTDLEIAGQVANGVASDHVFDDYLSRKADNTIRAHAAALAVYVDYLQAAGVNGVTADELQHDPEAWRGTTWGIVEGFRNWMVKQGYAVATVNQRLSVIKKYATLAGKAGAVDAKEMALIRTVTGYSHKEGKRIDERRLKVRVSDKKIEPVSLTNDQAEMLKAAEIPERDNPAQQRRDSFLMCLLLDHGLRVSEVVDLKVTDFNLTDGEMSFYRPKVDLTSTHELTADTLRAALAYFDHDAPAMGGVILGSVKSGDLTDEPMSARAITKRVNYLGETLLGLDGLSAHDCRHYCATTMARLGYGVRELMDWFGWSSAAMAVRYIESAEVAKRDKG